MTTTDTTTTKKRGRPRKNHTEITEEPPKKSVETNERDHWKARREEQQKQQDEQYRLDTEPYETIDGEPLDLLFQVDNIRVYEQDITNAIQAACDKYGFTLEQLREPDGGPWSTVMRYVGKTVFRRSLFCTPADFVKVNGERGAKAVIDVSILDVMADYYILLCTQYSKFISMIDFCLFVNINPSSFKDDNGIYGNRVIYHRISNNDDNIFVSVDGMYTSDNDSLDSNIDNSIINSTMYKDNSNGIIRSTNISSIRKRLFGFREKFIEDKAVYSKSVIGAIAVGNHELGWAGNTKPEDGAEPRTLRAADLPRLGKWKGRENREE